MVEGEGGEPGGASRCSVRSYTPIRLVWFPFMSENDPNGESVALKLGSSGSSTAETITCVGHSGSLYGSRSRHQSS